MSDDLIGFVGPNTADAAIGVSGRAFVVWAVKILSATAAGRVTLRNGTSASDTAITVLEGVANQEVTRDVAGGKGLVFPLGLFVDIDASVTNYVVMGRIL